MKLPPPVAALSFALLAFALLALSACSAAQEKRLADGSWRISCGEAMNRCATRADTVCGDRGYQVLGGGTQSSMLGGTTGYRARSGSSTLIVRCGDAVADEDAAEPSTGAPAAQRLCIPGATQACVGPGGCSGGQACLPDGMALGACDCGGVAAPAVPSQAPSSDRPTQAERSAAEPSAAEPSAAEPSAAEPSEGQPDTSTSAQPAGTQL